MSLAKPVFSMLTPLQSGSKSGDGTELNVKYKEISVGMEWIPGLIAEGGSLKQVV
jgi:hypothetical protein